MLYEFETAIFLFTYLQLSRVLPRRRRGVGGVPPGPGFSLAQVGIAEGVFHVVSFLCEVPSGMLADLVGRKRALALSGLFGMLSALAMAFSQDFFGVCLSMAFQALMYNLCSGTQEALTYDSLKAVGQEGSYLKRNAWLMGASQASASLSSLLGGAAALLGFFPAYLITAACSAVCASAAFALVEPQVTEAQRQRTEHPFAQLGPRFRAHLRESWGFFRRNPRAAYKIMASAAAATPIYLTFMYLQQHLLDGGLPELFFGGGADGLPAGGHGGHGPLHQGEGAAVPPGGGLRAVLRGGHLPGGGVLVAPVPAGRGPGRTGL